MTSSRTNSRAGAGVLRPPSRSLRLATLPLALLLLGIFSSQASAEGIVAAGDRHSGAINQETSDGTSALWAWGENRDGRLGVGTRESVAVPAKVSLGDWEKLSFGAEHSVALRGGALYVWGENGSGQLGIGTAVDSQTTPVPLDSATDWVDVRAGDYHTLAVKENGSLWAWGVNNSGQLGTGAFAASPTPVEVPLPEGMVALEISAGGNHSLAIVGVAGSASGTLYGWGNNLENQVGAASSQSIVVAPTQIGDATSWTSISAGGRHSLALRSDGTLWAWGNNREGQLGLASSFGAAQPTQVQTSSAWTLIEAGTRHSLALRSDGTLWAWGHNTSGQLGLGSFTNTRFPTQVPLAGFTPVAIAAGGAHSLIADAEGAALAAGSNSTGQLGLEGVAASNVFVQLAFIDPEDLPTPPDLAVADITVDTGELSPDNVPLAVIGADLGYSFTLQNIGGRMSDEATALPVLIYLSRDNRLDESDLLLETVTADGPIAEGGSVDLSGSISLPEELSPDDFRVLFVADPANAVEEGNEDNNIDALTRLRVQGEELSDALDNPVLYDASGEIVPTAPAIEVATGGSGFWFGQSSDVVDASLLPIAVNPSAAASPSISVGQSAFMEAIIPGPSTLTFWWAADTSSPLNELVLTIDGAEPADAAISGNEAFQEISFVLPAIQNKVRWTYTKGEQVAGLDRVYVDYVTVEEISQPDFQVDNVDFPEGLYVPGRDEINVTLQASNRGQSLQTATPVEARNYLSFDRTAGNEDDIFLGDVLLTQRPEADDRFGFSAVFPIPDFVPGLFDDDEPVVVPSGNYYLISIIDPVDDLEAEDSEAPEDFGAIDEVRDRANNIFISSTPSVEVQTLPDLVPTSLKLDFIETPAFLLVGDTVQIEFSISNQGLEDTAGQPFRMSVLLSSDRTFDASEDVVFFSTTETVGLPRGQVRTYKFLVEITPELPIGDYFFMGLLVDSEGDIAESSEKNNVTGSGQVDSADSDLILSRFTIDQATENPPLGRPQELNRDIINGSTVEDPNQRHFFGQNEVFFEPSNPRAAQSADIGNNETAAFEFLVNTPVNDTPGVISFAWKVSSERFLVFVGSEETQDDDVLKEDYLAFFINGQEMKRISGEVDWTVESFQLPPGQSVVRWEYVKDSTDSAGADAGWVDRIVTDSPNLHFDSDLGLQLLTEVPEEGLNRDSSIDIQLSIINDGPAFVEPSPPYFIEFRISPDPQFDDPASANSNDYLLGVVRSDNLAIDALEDGLEAGEEVLLTTNFGIPDEIAQAGDYYIFANIDSTGAVAESNEEDNLVQSGPVLRLAADVPLASAVDFESAHGWNTGGNANWFGFVDDPNLDDDTFDGEDATRTSPALGVNQETWLETVVEGPGIVSFYWSVDSVQSFNYLNFSISGIEQDRISGDIPFGLKSGTFRFVKDSRPTQDIGVGASAEDVMEALNELDTIPEGVTVEAAAPQADGTVRYTIAFEGDDDHAQIRANTTGLGRRVNVTLETLQDGDGAGTGEVQRITISPRLEFFVPAGEQVLRWTYSKRSSATDDDIRDAAFLDQIEFDDTAVTQPDLALKRLEVEGGTFVIDRLDEADLDRVPVSVVAENRGVQVPLDLGAADLEIRLSADDVFGNGDDIPLATVTRTLEINAAGQMIFEGDILLPLTTPEGNYYVAAYVDFADRVEEFTFSNYVPFTSTDNNLAITGGRSVTVEKRADLRIFGADVAYDTTKLYYPQNSMEIDYIIRNRGLRPISAATPWNVKIDLYAISIALDLATVDDPLDLGFQVDTLSDVDQNLQINAVTDANPLGGSVEIDGEVIFSTAGEIDDALPIGFDIEDFQYFLVFEIDGEDSVPESDERNVLILRRPFLIKFPGLLDFASWSETFESVAEFDTNSDPDFDGLSNFAEYAMSTNPEVPNPLGDRLLNYYGFVTIDREEYLALTFDLNNQATDIVYYVEVSVDGGPFTPVLELEPPYTESHGPRSLTGIGGLLDHELVIEILRLGTDARVTVRDPETVDERGSSTVLMRLRLVQTL